MENKLNWIKEINISKKNEGKIILCYRDKSFVVDNIIKEIVTIFQQNNLNFDCSFNLLNNVIFNGQLLKENLEKYLNDLHIKLNSSSSKSKLDKIIILGNPSKIKRFDFLIRLFSLPYKILLLFITLFFTINFISTLFIHKTSSLVHIQSKFHIPIYILGVLVILFWHELGHVIAAKKYHLNIKEIGVGIYLVFPVLYVDLNNIWSLAKKHRIIINLGGLYFQSILGLILLFLFSLFKLELLSQLFYANLSILLLNLIPIFKFDGYWLFSDIFNIHNLSKKSNTVISSLLKFKPVKFKENSIILLYSAIRIFFYIYIAYNLLKLINYIIFNFSKELVISFFTNTYVVAIITLLLIKTLFNYGKRIFNKKERII